MLCGSFSFPKIRGLLSSFQMHGSHNASKQKDAHLNGEYFNWPLSSNESFFFPQGSSWEHILTDLPIVSISVGSKRRVWVIAENGTAYFRAGFGENKIIGMDCNMKEKSSHLPAG